VGAGRSSYSARRRVSAPEDAYPRPGYRLRSRTTATTRRTSGGRYSYRSRAQIAAKVGGPNGLIHRLGWAGSGKIPAQPVNKSGEAIRWSARGKGADHRVNADKASGTQKGCQNCCQPVFDLTRTGADFTSEHAVLASLQDARISSPRVRGSYPLLPRNDPRLPAANPAGLEWSESNGKTSRKPAPPCTNPSLMQPCRIDRAVSSS
jgi:hypothetical protein